MTAREIKIARKILDYFHELDGVQAHALSIHAELGGLVACTADELEEVLAKLNTAKYVIGVTTKFRGVMWSISDQGEAARLQM